MLEQYGHGGDLRTAEEIFGKQAGSFLDFSSNMNPFGPPEAVSAVIRQFAGRIAAYPDPAARGLTSRLAERHGVPEASVLAGNGAAELIDLAVRAARPRLTALALPCFTEYGGAVRKAGGGLTTVRLSRERGFQLTADHIRSAQGAPDAWFLGSPNNPTGMPVDGAIIELLLDSGSFVFLDEAFVDFLPDEADRSFAHRAAETRNLVVIRSMTKFYAVPGIRLGYAVGHPQTIAAMRELQIPWSVNTLAQEIGAAVLKDTAYGRRTIAWLREERPWLAGRLEALGLTVYPGAANYILFELPERFGMDAATLQRALGRQGILIRDASLFAGLNGMFCRVAVKLREQNERLIGTMKAIVDEAVSGGGGGEGRE